jgi:hypothetical protein
MPPTASPRRGWLEPTSLCLLLAALLIIIPHVSAVSCFCYNGHTVSSTSCACACNPGYLLPTCSFGVSDSVGIVFSLNMTAEDFVAELFTNAVAYAASVNASFMWGMNVTSFAKVRAAVSIPGYSVGRLLDSVRYRDAWVNEYNVVSAHVITPTSGDAKSSFVAIDVILFQSGNVIITVNSIIWIICGMVLCVLLVGIENGLTHNDEHIVQPTALKHRRSQSMRRGKSDLDAPKRALSNLNEHRRKAPPPTMSLPEQILEDFVDSDEDDGNPKTKTSSKYSLGSKSRSGGAMSRSHSPQSPSGRRHHS